MNKKDITDQELLTDLTKRVEKKFEQYKLYIPELVARLDMAGTGVLESYREAYTENMDERVVNQVTLALIRDFSSKTSPYQNRSSDKFERQIEDYYVNL